MKRSPNTTPSRTEPDASPKLAPGLASESTGPWRRSLRHPLLLLVVAGITSGIVAAIAGASGTATLLWAGTTLSLIHI